MGKQPSQERTKAAIGGEQLASWAPQPLTGEDKQLLVPF